MTSTTHAGRRVIAAAVIAVTAALATTSAAFAASAARPAAASAAAATPACKTSGLEVWLGLGPGGGTAGSTYHPIEFTNVTGHTCHLYGFPGVSAVNGSAHQLGSAAGRDHASAPHTVTLAPGATGHVLLRLVDVLNYPPAVCHPAAAAGLRVFPPGQAASALVLGFSFLACSAKGPAYLSVRPIQPGVGIPGRP